MKPFIDTTGKLLIAFLLIIQSVPCTAQSKMIQKVFRLLPPAVVYNLNNAAKDSLLAGKTYYPPDNDSESVLAFNVGTSGSVNDYMYISMSFETAQRGSGMVELRSFQMPDNKYIIVVSKTGGVEGINYQQHDIATFLYDGDTQLKPYKTKIFPDWSIGLFLKPDVPDSVKKIIINNSNLTFHFSNTNVVLSNNSSYLLNNEEYRKWMKGDQINYTWAGNKFTAEPVHFSE